MAAVAALSEPMQACITARGYPRFSPSPACFTGLCLNVVYLSLAKLMRGVLMRCLHLLSNSSCRIPCRTLEALPRLAHFTSGLVKAQLKAVSQGSASAWQQQLSGITRGVAAAAMPDDITYLCAHHFQRGNLLLPAWLSCYVAVPFCSEVLVNCCQQTAGGESKSTCALATLCMGDL